MIRPETAALAVTAGLAVAAVVLLMRARRRQERHLALLETIDQINRVLLTERNRAGLLRLVARSAAQLAGVDSGYVALLAPDAATLVLEAATGPLAPLVGSVVGTDGTPAGEAVRSARRVLVPGTQREGGRWRSLHAGVTLRAAAALPLLLNGKAVGVLGVENPRSRRALSEEAIALVSDLASHTALVMESVRAVTDLAARERRAALVNAVNGRIRQTLDLQTILEAAVRELGGALEVSRCFVRLRRGAELLPAAAEWHAPEVPSVSARPDPTVPLQLAASRERRTIQTPDARTDPGLPGGIPEATEPLAVLATPILLQGEAIGVLAFHRAGLARYWRDDEIGLVEEVAAELAVGLANARLFRSAEDASRELAMKIAELERANRMKAQFLANMSHDLRTPLNAVIGFSEMLLLGAHGTLTADQRDALETVARNGRHLLGLVNDVLDLSKVEAGRMELRLAATDLGPLIHDVIEGMHSLIAAKEHDVAVELAEGPLAVRADELRVRQILFNLIANAVKFTPNGGRIGVRAERVAARPAPAGAAPARGAVRITVADNGIGIAPEDLPRLFTEFSQVDGSHARRYEGTGLGLALCKRFVGMHGGEIGVESAPGRGSSFWFTLPAEGPRPGAAG